VSRSLLVASIHPERVLGLVAIAPGVPVTPKHSHFLEHAFDDELDSYEGWAKVNRHYWQRDYRGWVEFHSSYMFAEPH
jgi:hypothetical protein